MLNFPYFLIVTFPKIPPTLLNFRFVWFYVDVKCNWLWSLLPNGSCITTLSTNSFQEDSTIYNTLSALVGSNFVVLFGYVGTTVYYSNCTAVCPVTNLHHMASLQSASSSNSYYTSYAGIVSLMYSNTHPPLLPILSFLNITQPASPNSAYVISLFAHDSVIYLWYGVLFHLSYCLIRYSYLLCS